LRKEEAFSKKLKMLKVKDPQSFELLNKLATTSGNKTFDWTKLPVNTNYANLKTLEDLELIFTKDFSDYILLFGKTKDFMGKL
jgi:hypothetical protein